MPMIKRSPKPKEYILTNFLLFNAQIWWSKTENITTEMYLELMLKIDVLETSRDRHPPYVFLGCLLDVFGMFHQKAWNYETANSLMFQLHIWLNTVENNAMKMYLYERLKIDALGTFQGRHPRDVFSGHLEDVQNM